MSHFYREVMWRIEQLSPEQWLLLLLASVIVGAVCLRGFGSRSSY